MATYCRFTRRCSLPSLTIDTDQIKTITCSVIVDNALSPKRHMTVLIQHIAEEIASKLMEFHKVKVWDAGHGRTGYYSSFDIIIPPTPENQVHAKLS